MADLPIDQHVMGLKSICNWFLTDPLFIHKSSIIVYPLNMILMIIIKWIKQSDIIISSTFAFQQESKDQ